MYNKIIMNMESPKSKIRQLGVHSSIIHVLTYLLDSSLDTNITSSGQLLVGLAGATAVRGGGTGELAESAPCLITPPGAPPDIGLFASCPTVTMKRSIKSFIE